MNKFNKIKNIRINVLKMLVKRKVNVPSELFTINDKLLNKKIKTNDLYLDIKNYYIKFIINNPKTSVIKNILEEVYEKYNNKNIIIILEKKPNNTILKYIQNKPNFQIFKFNELIIDISEHDLVPKHSLIIDKSKHDEILEKYELESKKQLPIIYSTDPMAKYFNAKQGDIFKIKRNSFTSGTYIYYRCVINPI